MEKMTMEELNDFFSAFNQFLLEISEKEFENAEKLGKVGNYEFSIVVKKAQKGGQA